MTPRAIPIAVLFGVLASPPALAADERPTFFMSIYDDSKIDPEIVRNLNEGIDRLRRLSEIAISDDRDKANYSIDYLELSVRPLQVGAKFRSSRIARPAQHEIGDCFQCSDPKSQVELALADLLDKTLFHPERGPYAPITVTDCISGDANVITLDLKWPKGPGLELRLPYELATYTTANDRRRMGYVRYSGYVSDPKPAGDALSARVKFNVTETGRTPIDVLKRCSAAVKNGRLFLFLHFSERIEQVGKQNPAPRALQ